jgi:hypothetical protein
MSPEDRILENARSSRIAPTSTAGVCKPNPDPLTATSLKRMLTIKPGMTRAALLKAFTTEGGLSTGLRRTFVSRDCPYFKVDIEFKAVARPDRDDEGRVTLTEDPRDLIVTISRPYLAFSVID